MSISDISTILARIESATSESPIAVFDIGRQDAADAMFAATAYVQSRLSDRNLIGIFDGGMHRDWIRNVIERRLRRNALRMAQIAKTTESISEDEYCSGQPASEPIV